MRIKTVSILFSLIFISFFAVSQNYKYVYYLDENFASVDKTKSAFTGKGVNENGLFKLDCFNKVTGNYFMSVHFTDSTLSVFQGSFISFYANQKKENEGNFLNGVKNGVWKRWDFFGNIVDSSMYDNGIKLIDASSTYYGNETLQSFTIVDTIKGTFNQVEYDQKGAKTDETTINEKSSFFKVYDNNGNVKKDSTIIYKDSAMAYFPGGDNGWKRYMERNLNAAVPVENGAKPGTYKVIVDFNVDRDGTISDVNAETNYGFGMEEECIRVISNGPNWIPAFRNQRLIKSLRKQPITFLVEKQ